ncbi:MAG: H-type small acid-soluble spore protein [Firmicutes bacterium HGW-Firmicutes-1]|jgi:H-type small acid-soluble spore protein|nr:MAG: H-type small acid-soluble spore protein [Firmicutes bacterium HGW-Firmicutes-1]
MDIENVQRIMESNGVIEVDYMGQSIWIQGYNKDEQTVEIGLIGSKESKVVNANELNEVDGG